MSLSYGILGFLNYGPMTGYELIKVFDSSLDFFWHAQPSHIYLELKKLEAKGYISGDEISQTSRPNKRLFSVTDAGQRAFLEWLSQAPGEEVAQFKSSFMMKVFFGGSQPPAQTAAILRQFQAVCGAFLARMEAVPGTIRTYGDGKDPYRSLCWQFTADFGARFASLCADWAGECAERLEELDRQKAEKEAGV